MLKFFFVFATVALALTLTLSGGQVSATHTFDKELTQNLKTCLYRLPPAITGNAGVMTKWYLKYSDEILWNRLLEIFLTGKEDVPVSQVEALSNSPCVTVVNEPWIDGVPVSETWTSGALGVQIPVKTTLHIGGVTQTVLYFPNTETPAETFNWVPVLTDGKTFNLIFACHDEGFFSWAVFATVPELAPYSIDLIKKYLNDAGFHDVLGADTLYRASQCTNKP